MNFRQQREEFAELLWTRDFSTLRERSLNGGLRKCSIRGLLWEVLLGCLPGDLSPNEWPKVIEIHRKEYKSLLDQYLIDPYSSGKEMPASICNPLSTNEENPWNKFFQRAELEKEINQDIERTYPESEFFQQKSIQELMLRILFIYARQNPKLSYKQGMHELLAPIVYVLMNERSGVQTHTSPHDGVSPYIAERPAAPAGSDGLEAAPTPDASVQESASDAGSVDPEPGDVPAGATNASSDRADAPTPVPTPDESSTAESDGEPDQLDATLRPLLDPQFIEHDAFLLFCGIMGKVKEWFAHGNSTPLSRIKSLSGDAAPFTGPMEDHAPIVVKCKHIQNDLLSKRDAALHQHLVSLHIEPQVYMLRWVRLLFGREFHLEDLLPIWDAIFAYSPDLSLIDHICVAMMVYIREQVVGKEYTLCMRRLFKFPPVEDPYVFVLSAQSIINGVVDTPEKTAALTNLTSSLGSSRGTPAPSPAVQRTEPARNPQLVLTPNEATELFNENEQLKTRQHHTALRLERIIYSLHTEIYDRKTLPIESDPLVLALAELKQIKDILNGWLPDDAEPKTPPVRPNNLPRSASTSASTPAPTPAPTQTSPPTPTTDSFDPLGAIATN
eukprot:TRINITY_DN7193_c0_g1_i1.p1 TRINITY_DN7193_c0_g1~~TRINITY_DN7193_c0_g1_i1.p1  ORF type:complete len:614 (+),score=159.05 TRINITY_DN7193_c0_g1_i1:232-2073(+)